MLVWTKQMCFHMRNARLYFAAIFLFVLDRRMVPRQKRTEVLAMTRMKRIFLSALGLRQLDITRPTPSLDRKLLRLNVNF